MTIDERQRYQLHQSLETHLGPESAATLMAYLPPVGWADVATKHDLVALEQRLDLRFEGIGHRFTAELADVRTEIAGVRTEIADVRTEIHATVRAMTLTIIGATAAIVGAAAGVVTGIAALTNLFG